MSNTNTALITGASTGIDAVYADAEAAERGVFGSPTIFVGEAMFSGNDRLDFVREELARLEEAA